MKILCVGRNYVDHATELKNPIPDKPLIFMKPSSALLVNNKPFYYPEFTNDLHYEVELVVKICRNGRHVQPEFASNYFDQVAVGIDFTARDIQSDLKEKGHPWEIAKGFDNSAALSSFVSKETVQGSHFTFSLNKNNIEVQRGNTKKMIFSIEDIICYTSKFFTLHQGDIIYTGTPSGVGPVKIGDKLEAFLEGKNSLVCDIK